MKYIPIKLRRKTKEEKGRQGGNWREEGEEERVFYYCLFFFFWLHCVVCGILVPQLGVKPMPPAVEA